MLQVWRFLVGGALGFGVEKLSRKTFQRLGKPGFRLS